MRLPEDIMRFPEDIMPNWTTNCITVSGPSQNVYAMLAACAGLDSHGVQQKFTFTKIIPQPADLYRGPIGPIEEKLYREGYRDWYSWNCENWGTKWDACDVVVSVEEADSLTQLAEAALDERTITARIRFESAWSEPNPVIRKLMEKFPDVSIECRWHHEGGYGGGYMSRDVDYEFGENEPEARESCIALKGFDPWRICYECGGEVEESRAEPDAMCKVCAEEACIDDDDTESGEHDTHFDLTENW